MIKTNRSGIHLLCVYSCLHPKYRTIFLVTALDEGWDQHGQRMENEWRWLFIGDYFFSKLFLAKDSEKCATQRWCDGRDLRAHNLIKNLETFLTKIDGHLYILESLAPNMLPYTWISFYRLCLDHNIFIVSDIVRFSFCVFN